MNRELYIHTLRMLREQYEIARMDTVVETIDAALAEFERPTDSDCISRQAAIDAICGTCHMRPDYLKCNRHPDESTSTWCEEVASLKALPSAQPEIIRCKDCSKWHTVHCPFFSKYITVMPNEEQYCGFAERRPDEQGTEAYKAGYAKGKEDAQQWISCKDRLPEIAKRVLVTLSNGNVIIAQHHTVKCGSEDTWVFEPTGLQFMYDKTTVVAWMPLPEPYAERRTDEKA